jgi:prepilin-type N-terminal cleavage/methylation domain-containing protein
MGRFRRQAGFTLVELSVVVALIGVLATLAISVDPEDQATSDAFADQLVSDFDQIRLRAMATRRWQRLVFSSTQGALDEAAEIGMPEPTEWVTSGVLTPPKRIVIDSIADRAHVDPTGASPGEGVGLDLELRFAPDGTATSRTIYISDIRGKSRARVVVFAATGSARAYRGW